MDNVKDFLWMRENVTLPFVARTVIPDKEKLICSRLREFRKSTKLSQVAFANEIGLDSSQLATYEHARAPIKYGLVLKIVHRFPCSERWLAEGKGPKDVPLVPPDQFDHLEKSMLFSNAYFKWIKPRIDKCLSVASEIYGCEVDDLSENQLSTVYLGMCDIPTLHRELLLEKFQKDYFNRLLAIPPRLHFALLKALGDAFEKFALKHPEVELMPKQATLDDPEQGT